MKHILKVINEQNIFVLTILKSILRPVLKNTVGLGGAGGGKGSFILSNSVKTELSRLL